jgi:hypothetical protein
MKVCGKFQGLSNPSGCLISVPNKGFVFGKDGGAAERIEASGGLGVEAHAAAVNYDGGFR